MNGRRCHGIGVHDAALRRDHERATLETGFAQLAAEAAKIVLHDRLERCVDTGRYGSPVFAQGGIDAVGQSHGYTRQMRCQKFAQAKLMLGIDDRPEETHRNRRDLRFPKLGDHLPCGRFVEQLDRPARRIDTLRDFERQGPEHIGFGIRDGKIEGLDPAALANDEYVAVPLRREQRRARDRTSEDGIDGSGRTVDERTRPTEESIRGLADVGRRQVQSRNNPLYGVGGNGRRLVHTQASRILDQQIGEGAADIARDTHGAHYAGRPPSSADEVVDLWQFA
jgi:hypothetical protein